MNYQSIPPIILATIALYVGIYHYFLFSGVVSHKREKIFTLLCIFVGFYDISCALLYNSNDIATSHLIQTYQLPFIAIVCCLIFIYVDQFYLRVPRFFKNLTIATAAFAIFASFFASNDLFWDTKNSRLFEVNVFDLFTYSVLEVSPGPILKVLTIIIFFYFSVLYYFCIKKYLKQKTRYNSLFLFSLTIFTVTLINDSLLGSFHLYKFIYLIEYGFVAIIVFSAYLNSQKLVDIDFLRNLNTKLKKEIAERIKAEQEAEIFQEKMISSSKWITIGEMAGGIAHEINNPLMVIKGNAQIIRKKYSSEPIKGHLEKIEKTVDRIHQIILALKRVSRDSKLDPFKKVNLLELINDSVSLCSDKLNYQRIEIEINCSDDIFIDCHYTELSQVFLNFINNSIDAIEENNENSLKKIMICATSVHGFVKIQISDTGAGMSPITMDRLFEPFYTTKEVGKGTGLGMSITKEIIEIHHGSVFIDRQSKLTQFVISLPINQDT
ncbi:sensor histidine kinase [Halobacteriovorax sp. HLS]|uniref:sensor histidine kinase n=1 Tax=Halobacteriovorax sp. HLS TaxID=2234000 RepID=UPI000FDA0832|nr:HAMP domain-containing sensor histidine kinase [Halobacteriovorax sp. HLS]